MYGLDEDQIQRLLEIGEAQVQELMGSSPVRTLVSETEGEEAASSTPANLAGTPGGECCL